MDLDGLDLEELLSEERTLLAKERTSLSYIRTGTTVIAVGLAALKLFELNYLISLLGMSMIIFGLLIIVYHAMWDRRYVYRIKYFEGRIRELDGDERLTDKSLKK